MHAPVSVWFLLVLVPTAFAVGIVGTVRYQNSLNADRSIARDQQTLLVCRPAKVKLRMARHWGFKTMWPMEVVVKESFVIVHSAFGDIGSGLGNEWYFRPETLRAGSTSLRGELSGRPWVRLEGRSGNRSASLVVRLSTDFDELLQLLRTLGASDF